MDTLKLISEVERLFSQYGYILVFTSSFIEITPFGFTIPGGAILAVGGYFAYGTQVNLFFILLFSWLGAWITFLLAYFLGFYTGPFLVKKLKQEKNQKKAKILLQNHGPVILTTSMLANLTRFWVAYVAGEQKYNFPSFLFYSAIASLTWSSLMVIIGYLAGSERGNIEKIITSLGILSWFILIGVIFCIYFIIKKEFKNLKQEK